MRICLKRNVWGFMSKPFRYKYGIGAEMDQRGGVGVPKVMNTDFLDSGTLHPDIKGATDIVELLRE